MIEAQTVVIMILIDVPNLQGLHRVVILIFCLPTLITPLRLRSR